MATISRPTRALWVDNCPIGHVASKNTTDMPDDFMTYPDFFYMTLLDDTATEYNTPSENNPMKMYITTDIKTSQGGQH